MRNATLEGHYSFSAYLHNETCIMRYVDMCVFLKIGCLESRAVGPFLPGHCLPLIINLSIPHEWETESVGRRSATLYHAKLSCFLLCHDFVLRSVNVKKEIAGSQTRDRRE